jgi:putative (di)nucleoside polyphosphate hydrolase
MSALALSCGVLVLCPEGDVLLCHATGGPRWDIPKGMAEIGEWPLHAAVREVKEETSLDLATDALLDLGRFAYLRGKDLHLFAALIDRIDLSGCVCTSRFIDARGRERPEVDAFAWVPWAEAPERTGKSLATLLRDKVAIDSVRRQLATRARPGV